MTSRHFDTSVPKRLALDPARDEHERQADRVAQHVVRNPAASQRADLGAGGMNGDDATDRLQRALQVPIVATGQHIFFRGGAAGNRGGRGRPLPATVRDPMEQALQVDLRAVRVHTDARAHALNHGMQARAFTTGPDIFFRRGAFDPGSRHGRELIAHELTHVIQQRAGTAPVAVQRKVVKNKLGEQVDLDLVRFDQLRGMLANDLFDKADMADVDERMEELRADFFASSLLMRDLLKAVGIRADSKSKITPAERFSPAQLNKVRANVARRLKDGPPLPKSALKAIKSLGGFVEGGAMLDLLGLDTYDNAKAYLRAGDYKQWLKIGVKKRVLYATIAWREGIGEKDDNPPPAYTLGRHMAIKGGRLPAARQAQEEQARDEHIREAFVNTLTQTTMSTADQKAITRGTKSIAEPKYVRKGEMAGLTKKSQQATQILTRVFLILQAGLQVYDPGQQKHIDYQQGDVARALAHGGRVNIRIPALKHGGGAYDLTDWIGITTGSGKQTVEAVGKRGFGTHHMDITENTYDAQGNRTRRGRFEEAGGKGAAASNRKNRKGVKLWGMNVAGGGLGNLDFNGDVILPDGSHGHMFIGLTKPTTNSDGALQIGLETTAPHRESLVGYEHNWNSTEATANPESSFYGHKSAKVGKGGLKRNERYVDLEALATPNASWLEALEDLEDTWNTYLQNEADKATAYRKLVGPRS